MTGQDTDTEILVQGVIDLLTMKAYIPEDDMGKMIEASEIPAEYKEEAQGTAQAVRTRVSERLFRK